MKLLSLAIAAASAGLALHPALAQEEADGEPNLEAIDMLFGDRTVTGGEDNDADAADATEEDAATADADSDADDPDAEAADPDEPQISDLTRALAGYEDCALQAGAGLIDQGFSPEQAGEESLLACSGARAAYVNGFYFELLPRYPGAEEAEVRASAERLARQTDAAVIRLVIREAATMPRAINQEEPSE